MAVTAKTYAYAIKSAFNKEIDLDTDVIKVMLVASGYTPSQATHQYKSSVTNEATGAGYTATGATIASPTVGVTSLTFKFDAADVTWSAATVTARYAVIYDSSPASDATRPLLSYVDFGADVVCSGGDFVLAWDAAGICTATVA